nr:unnamed protein product [Spirometra erinaceieuropaei]
MAFPKVPLQDRKSGDECMRTEHRSISTSAAATAATAAAEENVSVENRQFQVRDTVQSTALAVYVRARRQHQDWFDENDASF